MEFIKRNFEIRAGEEVEKPQIVGRPIVFDSRTNLEMFDEIIERGALDNSDLSDVRFLVNHDLTKIPLARAKKDDPNSTMRMTVDKDGLSIVVDLDVENNPEAKALYSAVKRGDISGMSFMFGVNGEEWENLESEHPTRHIKSISKVMEVSAVTFPAYEETEINARALDKVKNNSNSLELELLKIKYLYNI